MKRLEDKLSGSYYTPIKTVQFMKAYLLKEKRRRKDREIEKKGVFRSCKDSRR